MTHLVLLAALVHLAFCSLCWFLIRKLNKLYRVKPEFMDVFLCVCPVLNIFCGMIVTFICIADDKSENKERTFAQWFFRM